MKKLSIFFPLASLICIVLAMLVLTEQTIARDGPIAPTLAPKPTNGPPPTSVIASSPKLEHPLTKAQAIQKVFEYDQRIALWQESWSLETFSKETQRITVQLHPDRTYNGSELGEGTENGPVWSVTIKGKVQLPMMDHANEIKDGITYDVSVNTGEILGFITGPTISK